MKQKLATICGVAMVASLPTVGFSGVIMEITQLADPAPGLQSFIVTAVGTEGLTVGSIAQLRLTDVHQVWENSIAGAGASTPKAIDLEGTFWNSSWNALDTHFLLNPATMLASPGMGVEEANDGSNPAGLNLPGPTPFEAYTGVAGMGDLHFIGSAAQVTFAGDFRESVDFLQVVVPENTFATLDVTFIDSSSSGFIVYEGVMVGIPEPAGLALLGLTALPLLRRRRGLH